MGKKREIKRKFGSVYYKCAKCGEFFPRSGFYIRKVNGKEYVYSYCRKCDNKKKMETTKEETKIRAKKRYKNSYKGWVRQLIDDMLYKWKIGEKFRKSKEILEKLNEWDAKKYKKEYLLNVMKMDGKIWDWLYENGELPEKEVIKFLLGNKRKWRKKEIKEQLGKRLKELEGKCGMGRN